MQQPIQLLAADFDVLIRGGVLDSIRAVSSRMIPL
jgi:hypothetical protein